MAKYKLARRRRQLRKLPFEFHWKTCSRLRRSNRTSPTIALTTTA